MKQTLRPYQQQCVDDVREAFRLHRRVVAQLPTGAGKTSIAAGVAEMTRARGGGVWFVAHRRELVLQAKERLEGQGLDVGVIMAGHEPVHEHAVQVVSIDTLNARWRADAPLPALPNLCIVDEAHHAPSTKWDELWRQMEGGFLLGLSATPYRADGVGLGSRFGRVVLGPTPESLRASGHLVPADVYCGPVPDLKGVGQRAGDWARGELATVCDRMVADVARTYRQLASGKRAICFAVNRAHSQHLVERFVAQGFRAAHIDFATPDEERKRIVGQFKDGGLDVLCNVEIVTEGFDVPGCEVVILARPTKSEALYVQMVGRGLRPAPGKERAVVLDHGYNVLRHGDPLEHRPAELAGRKVKDRSEPDEAREASPRICPACLFLNPPGASECRCGATLAPPPPEMDESVELQKLEMAKLEKQKAQRERLQKTRLDKRRAEFKSLEEFVRRTSGSPWKASYIYRDKYGKMPHEDTILTKAELGRYWRERQR